MSVRGPNRGSESICRAADQSQIGKRRDLCTKKTHVMCFEVQPAGFTEGVLVVRAHTNKTMVSFEGSDKLEPVPQGKKRSRTESATGTRVSAFLRDLGRLWRFPVDFAMRKRPYHAQICAHNCAYPTPCLCDYGSRKCSLSHGLGQACTECVP